MISLSPSTKVLYRIKLNLNLGVKLSLYLYSNQQRGLTDTIDMRLAEELKTKGSRIGYISSSPDGVIYYDDLVRFYSSYAINVTPYFDLEDNFNTDILDEIFSCPAIYLSGGDTFRFLIHLRKWNLIERLRKFYSNNGIIIGVSAGAILQTPVINTAEFCGDVNDGRLTDKSALNLTDFEFLPHFDDSNYEKALEYSKTVRRNIYACPDGGAVLVSENRVELLGCGTVLVNGVELTV